MTRPPLTSIGVLVAVLGVGFYALGARLGWVELLVVAAGALLAFLGALPFVLGRVSLDVARFVDPERVEVGDKAVAVLEIRNPKDSSVRPRVVEDLVDGVPVRVEVPTLGSGDMHETVFPLPTSTRGRVTVGPAVIARQDPLRLIHRGVSQVGPTTLWVHPKVKPVPALPVGFAKDLEGPTSSTSPVGDVAFHALREYEPGDDYRHIHWMSTAREGRPMVRQYVDNRRPHLTLLLDSDATAMTADVFELAVSVVASIGVSGHLHGQPIAVWVGADPLVGATMPGSRIDLLDRLSLVSQEERTPDLVAEALRATTIEVGTSALVFVTGGRTATELVALATAIRRRARVVIVRCREPGAGGATAVPGATVMDLEALEQLPTAWGRVR